MNSIETLEALLTAMEKLERLRALRYVLTERIREERQTPEMTQEMARIDADISELMNLKIGAALRSEPSAE